MEPVLTIWSKFGLWRETRLSELPGIVDASPATVEKDFASKGYCLTWCDVEPVAILRDYPACKVPDKVLAWVSQSKSEGRANG